MPEINEAANTYLLRTIADMQSRIGALETQQQFCVVDSSLAIRAILGLQPNGDYGLGVFDGSGNYGEVYPPKRSLYNGVITTTSATPSAGTGSPSVTCNIGASGDALLMVSCEQISTTVAGTFGFIGVTIDGSPSQVVVTAGAASSTLDVSGSSVTSVAQLLFPLTPGPHTFTLTQWGSPGGHTYTFSLLALVVWPV